MSQQMAQHLARLFEIIQSQRWSVFESVALPNTRVFQIICSSTLNIEESKGHKTLLHICLQNDPPFEIVAKMITMLINLKGALRAQDCRGRTPLHVAAACNADPMVIKLLGSTDPTTCTMLDEDSRTPLHLACDASCNLHQEEDGKRQPQQQRNAPSYDAVQALLSDSLAASLLEDADGMNSLERAILSGASLEVVTLLQKATMESMQERERQRSS